ncbi:predicted protein [Plenodomus lingam JN3]|uniref:Predicted protein n=1 Tax=Leptosphaeria maculans (strain JN3 / isolate v23.1.3 / race Av1-4-5-6-7-8) TaxID=985895 RepID=E4ZRJ1_LEPMJ|nr:predicted protein [Plenodomus lingam JN3]CBX93838.1 predicted protein [Plenodomus lingam JN3]
MPPPATRPFLCTRLLPLDQADILGTEALLALATAGLWMSMSNKLQKTRGSGVGRLVRPTNRLGRVS